MFSYLNTSDDLHYFIVYMQRITKIPIIKKTKNHSSKIMSAATNISIKNNYKKDRNDIVNIKTTSKHC
jgi:hypothetical protein